ncbi:nucleotide-diphospho-sugar transferase [Globomyces pollinis-pini]|nr:nucleotide-diphospho-sugar transferase [Globomyces pollinis-pini]
MSKIARAVIFLLSALLSFFFIFAVKSQNDRNIAKLNSSSHRKTKKNPIDSFLNSLNDLPDAYSDSDCLANFDLATTKIPKKSAIETTNHVSKIIHQSWKNNILPKKFVEWQNTWKVTHPDWEYKLWTDADNDKLCETDFPWFLERYKSFPENINRADVARYMYMYKYGGVYADLDVVCLRSHEPLVPIGGAIVPLMRNMPFEGEGWKDEHDIPNAWMASEPGHPFWLYLLKHINSKDNNGQTEALSGPIVEWYALQEFEKTNTDPEAIINYIAPGLIFPFDWRIWDHRRELCYAQSPQFNISACNSNYDLSKAFTITYWSHSWGDGDHLANIEKLE